MSNLIPFQFNTSSIRVVTTDDGEILFVASDVAIALGYTNPPKAVRDHCKKAKSLIDIDGTNRSVQQNQALAKLDPKTKLIPESDVYRLTLRSKLESAENFQDWLVEEVIPSIRKTGSYSIQPIDTLKALSDPATMRQLLLGYTEKVIELESKVDEMQPKVEALDRLENSDGTLNVTEASKVLKVKRDWLFSYLNSIKWIYRRVGSTNWLGYTDKEQQGLVKNNTKTIIKPDGTEKITVQVRITAKGLTKLSELLNPPPTLLDRAISMVTGKRNGLVAMKGGVK